MVNLDLISTEKRNRNSMNVDKMSIKEILELINSEDYLVAYSIKQELTSIENLVDAATKCYQNGGRIIYIGAGTSGRLGIIDAVECLPTFGVDETGIVGIIAGGTKALTKAVEGAEDDEQLAINDLDNIKVNSKDIVIGIAASGRTPYVVSALKYAKSIGATTGSIAISKDTEISVISEFPVEVVVGPEVITGSTRMKAGSAQKMILNMISTTVMIRSGKVYQNLMVDVAPTNSKLVERSVSIVVSATSCSREEAIKALDESSGNAKIAIVMLLFNLDATKAKTALVSAKGFIGEVENV